MFLLLCLQEEMMLQRLNNYKIKAWWIYALFLSHITSLFFVQC